MTDPRPQAYQDGQGYLWLTAVQDGEVVLFCYDTGAARRMGDAWPTLTQAEVEAQYGLLTLLGPTEWELKGDLVLFLYGGGLSVPVDTGWAMQRWNWDQLQFAEVIPGHAIALLGMEEFQVGKRMWASGAFVVIRTIRP